MGKLCGLAVQAFDMSKLTSKMTLDCSAHNQASHSLDKAMKVTVAVQRKATEPSRLHETHSCDHSTDMLIQSFQTHRTCW